MPDAAQRAVPLPASHATPPVDLATLNPLHQDADALFSKMSARQVEAYAERVHALALEKQHATRTLVGQSYQDLLAVANTVVHMAQSLDHLCGSLGSLRTQLEAGSAPAVDPADAQGALSTRDAALAASLLLVADAPALVRSALDAGHLLASAWVLLAVPRAWGHVRDAVARSGGDAAARFPAAAAHLAELPALTDAVRQQTAALLRNARGTACVLECAAVRVLLGDSVEQAMHTLLHERRAAALAAVDGEAGDDAEAAFAQRAAALARTYAATMRHTHAVFAPRAERSALGALLSALETELPRLGADLLRAAPQSHALDAAQFYAHLPSQVCACAPAAPAAAPSAEAVRAAGGAWAADVRAAASRLAPLLDALPDAEALVRARAALDGTPAAAGGAGGAELDALKAQLRALLDARAQSLTQQELEQMTRAFAAELDAAIRQLAQAPASERDAGAFLFPAPPGAEPLHALHARPPLLDRCVALVERALHAASAADRTAREAACVALAEHLEACARRTDGAPDTAAFVMRVCAALHAGDALRHAPRASAALRAAHAGAGERWSATLVHAALARLRARAQRPPSLAPYAALPPPRQPTAPSAPLAQALQELVAAQIAAGGAARPAERHALLPPPLLPHFICAWAAGPRGDEAREPLAWDTAFLQTLLGASFAGEAHAGGARRSALAALRMDAVRALDALPHVRDARFQSHIGATVPRAVARWAVTLAPWLELAAQAEPPQAQGARTPGEERIAPVGTRFVSL